MDPQLKMVHNFHIILRCLFKQTHPRWAKHPQQTLIFQAQTGGPDGSLSCLRLCDVSWSNPIRSPSPRGPRERGISAANLV